MIWNGVILKLLHSGPFWAQNIAFRIFYGRSSKFGSRPKIVVKIRIIQNIRIFPDSFRIVEEKCWILKNDINISWSATKNESICPKIRKRKKTDFFPDFPRIFSKIIFLNSRPKKDTIFQISWKNEVICQKIRKRNNRIFSGFFPDFFENDFFDIQVKNGYWISNFMKKFQ